MRENEDIPKILSVDDLIRLMKHDDVLLLDARDTAEFKHAHLPGAANLDVYRFAWFDTTLSGIKNYQRHTIKVLSMLGVTETRKVVVYDDITGPAGARAFWMLDYLGHPDFAILNGGMNAWKARNLEATRSPANVRPAKFKTRIRNDRIASASYILSSLNNKNVRILDVRSAEEYNGTDIHAYRGGHIPGALHLEWKANIDKDGRLKPRDKLMHMYKKVGIERYQEIITYCQAGYRAAQSYLALRSIGFRKVRNYIGSWFEWGNTPNLPVEVPIKPVGKGLKV